MVVKFQQIFVLTYVLHEMALWWPVKKDYNQIMPKAGKN